MGRPLPGDLRGRLVRSHHQGQPAPDRRPAGRPLYQRRYRHHRPPGLNQGILSQGPYTLDTAYRITGAVASPDRSFKPARDFFGPQNVYQVIHVAGTGAYTLNLEVQMSSPPAAAPDEGLYTCGLMLTAGW